MGIRQMLEAEMEKSGEFAKSNFGLKVGDGYPELVREIGKSKFVGASLMLHVMIIGLSGGQGIKQSFEREKGADVDWEKVIIQNLDVFQGPIEMLYWGIEIGRRLQKEEDRAVGGLEGGNGSDTK